jgi:hypothetical protein
MADWVPEDDWLERVLTLLRASQSNSNEIQQQVQQVIYLFLPFLVPKTKST